MQVNTNTGSNSAVIHGSSMNRIHVNNNSSLQTAHRYSPNTYSLGAATSMNYSDERG